LPLDLSPSEHALLLEILRDELGSLKAEINRTETRGFKDELKEREATLATIIGRLEGPA
jgi:hypothetical protein